MWFQQRRQRFTREEVIKLNASRDSSHGVWAPEIDLINADLENVNLSHLNFVRINFEGANLRGANLDGIHLFSSTFRGADMTGCSMRNAVLTLVTLAEVKFYNADLTGMTLNGGEMLASKWKGAILRNASFLVHEPSRTGCGCWHADFSDSDLRETDLSGLKAREVQDANFQGALYNGHTRLTQGLSPAQMNMRYTT